MNNDVHQQALIEKSLQLKIIQYKYPRRMISIFDGLLITLKQDTFDEQKNPVEWQNYQNQEEI